jgi:hypothetical protein
MNAQQKQTHTRQQFTMDPPLPRIDTSSNKINHGSESGNNIISGNVSRVVLASVNRDLAAVGNGPDAVSSRANF